MIKSSKIRYHPLELLSIILVFGIIFFYTYAFFVLTPYLGFNFSTPSGSISELFIQSSLSEPLEPGDKIVSVGSMRWIDYLRRDADLPFSLYQPGDLLTLSISREGQIITILWQMPGFNQPEIMSRIASLPWLILPYLFWLLGSMTLLLFRTPNERRNLLAAFNFIVAIWLISGLASGMQIFHASRLFHLSIWFGIPIIWQLNWVLVKPKRVINTWVWLILYLATTALAILDTLRILPGNPYRIPIYLICGGSILIFFYHWREQPEKRDEIILLLASFCMAVIPGLVRILTRSEFTNVFWIDAIAIWSLLLIPISYFYIIFSHQLGSNELRFSNALVLIFFGTLIFVISYLAIAAIATIGKRTITPTTSIALVALMTGVFTGIVFPHFKTWVERKILHVPFPAQKILEHYADQIITARDEGQLIQILQGQIFPSLLIRQVSLIRLKNFNSVSSTAKNMVEAAIHPILSIGVAQSQIPSGHEIGQLLPLSGEFLPPDTKILIPRLTWIRLILPLQIDQDFVGICLFGRRDPEDYYAQTEIPTLQAIMSYTALAMVNSDQNRLLRNLYQDDIEQYEQERTHLALELHDEVLGQMALLAHSLDKDISNDAFFEAYQASVQKIRKIISGLYPPLLNYGLGVALTGLVDEFGELSQSTIEIQLDLPPSDVRYPPEVELHLYRITQQACQNAFQHGKPSLIRIQGRLTSDVADIIIIDNGIGFEAKNPIDMNWLLENQHFGLVGMCQRAEIIGAKLDIDSKPGLGTRVRATWQAPQEQRIEGSAQITHEAGLENLSNVPQDALD